MVLIRLHAYRVSTATADGNDVKGAFDKIFYFCSFKYHAETLKVELTIQICQQIYV